MSTPEVPTSAAELETLAPDGAPPSTTSKPIARGAVLGRYVVIDPIGHGGMGVVVAAYDPELDRKVAIKLLRWTDLDPARAARGAARLLLEAKALARLSHPNLVAVHDVGTVSNADGLPSVFVAMELLDGHDLTVWIKREQPSWRAVLSVYVAAGHGLEAAHNAGIIHRDFKPENVIRTTSGRVVVLDFGLARATHDTEGGTNPGEPRAEATSADPRLTVVGALIGTPAFMSPEQANGRDLDAASDQFSFCASLYLGLYGELPYGSDAGPLARAQWNGELRPPKGKTAVPAWVRAVLARGLARDRLQRFASMTELLAALARDPSHRRRQAAMAGAVLATIAGTWFAASRSTAPPDPCERAVAQLDQGWTAQRRDVISATLADGTEFGNDYARRVTAALDDHTQRVRELRLATCRDDASQATPSGDEVTRVVCLDRARDHLQALTSVIEQHGASVRGQALAAVSDLPDPNDCLDARSQWRTLPVPDDPARAAAVAALRLELVHVRSLSIAGEPAAALVALAPVLERCRALGDEPLLAEALMAGARAKAVKATFDDAIVMAEEAYGLAEANGIDVLALEALGALTVARTAGRRQLDLASWHSLQAEALVRRLGDPPRELARVLDNRARIMRKNGDHLGGIALLERAEGLLEAAGAESIDHVVVLDNLGSAHHLAGRTAEARHEFERALAIAERVLGPGHNLRVNVLLHLGAVRCDEGDRDGGLVLMRRALQGARVSYGATHPTLIAVLNAVALVVAETDPAAALAMFEEAVAISRRLDDAESVNSVEGNLADTYRAVGQMERATDLHVRVASRKRADPSTTPRALAEAHAEIADDFLAAGAATDALRELALAQAALASAVPPIDEPSWLLEALARAHLGTGALTTALDHAERAVERAATGWVDGLPNARLTLARALRANRRDHDRQLSLAVAAHRVWSNDPRKFREELARALGFLIEDNPAR